MRRGSPYGLAIAGLLFAAGPIAAADLARPPHVQAVPDLLQQTRPVGIASELPRSPLADVVSNDVERFDVWREAKARCPRDLVVWVPDDGQRYHAVLRNHQPGPEPGAFMCQADASAEGDWH